MPGGYAGHFYPQSAKQMGRQFDCQMISHLLKRQTRRVFSIKQSEYCHNQRGDDQRRQEIAYPDGFDLQHAADG